ncbi:MAG: hypothetical protein ABIA75_00540 [Candidatus Neomarinimicrobiota bacterium]
MNVLKFLMVFGTGLIFAGCSDSNIADPALTDLVLNARYPLDMTTTGWATLVNVVYEEAAVPGSAIKVRIQLAGNPVFGDLDGDGQPDGALILVGSSGGSGSFYYLAAIIFKKNHVSSTTTTFIGDRIHIDGLTIKSGSIRLIYRDREAGQAIAEEPQLMHTADYEIIGGELVRRE